MQRFGRYEILEELGRGAMGTVYRARDPKIDRIVALKTIRLPGLGAVEERAYRQRFFREAQAAGKLSHSGIVIIYDVGEEETTQAPYIVMEYVAGRSVDRLLSEAGEGPLPVEVTLDLVKQVAEALEYAHSQGIVHRDIKPANILVNVQGRAKIADFGIAKLTASQFTMTGEVLGTPSYMSPEQVSGKPVDGRSDLFSLGIILYWMLTGQKPFSGENLTEIAFKIAYKDPVPASHRNPALRPDFDTVLQRALAKNPAHRYQLGTEFAADLEDLRQGRPPRTPGPAAASAPEEQTVVTQPAPVAPVLVEAGAIAAMPLAAQEHTEPSPAASTGPSEKNRRPVLAVAIVLLLLLLGSAGWWSYTNGTWPWGPWNPEAEPAAAQQANPPATKRPTSRTSARSSPQPASESSPAPPPTEQASDTAPTLPPPAVSNPDAFPPSKAREKGPPSRAPARGRRR